MDFNQLKYFREIANVGSMTGAARSLLVSQPTLSVAIQKLEEGLATQLFLRDRRGVTLTSTGRELLHYSDQVFQLLETAEERIRGLQEEEVGRFVIACPEVLGSYFLPDLMAPFLQAAPRVQLTIRNNPSPATQEAVLTREAHFGLVVNPLPHPDLVLVDLFGDTTDLFVATQTDGPDPGSLEDALARLRAGPLIVVERLSQSRELLRRLSERRWLPTRRLGCGDLELVKSLVLAGIGVAVIPRRVAAYGQQGHLRRLHPEMPCIPDRIFLAYRADMHRTKAAMKLKNALVARGRAMDESDL